MRYVAQNQVILCCHFMSCYVTSFYVILYYVVSRNVMSFYVLCCYVGICLCSSLCLMQTNKKCRIILIFCVLLTYNIHNVEFHHENIFWKVPFPNVSWIIGYTNQNFYNFSKSIQTNVRIVSSNVTKFRLKLFIGHNIQLTSCLILCKVTLRHWNRFVKKKPIYQPPILRNLLYEVVTTIAISLSSSCTKCRNKRYTYRRQ